MRRVEFQASPRSLSILKATKGRRSLSETINAILEGTDGASGNEGRCIETLINLEKQIGNEREIDPEQLVADLFEFMAGANHSTLQSAIEDLIQRTERHIAEKQKT